MVNAVLAGVGYCLPETVVDNRDLVAGTTLYLPVFVPGALLSLGDGHAAQGEGEVGGSAHVGGSR